MYNYTKYQKQQWRVEDFGRGKSVVAKARHRRNSEFMKNYNMKEEVQLRNSTFMEENNPMKNSHISKKNHENQIGKKRPQTSLALTGTVFTNERKRNISESMKRLEKIQCNICLNFYSRSNISKHQQIHKAA